MEISAYKMNLIFGIVFKLNISFVCIKNMADKHKELPHTKWNLVHKFFSENPGIRLQEMCSQVLVSENKQVT